PGSTNSNDRSSATTAEPTSTKPSSPSPAASSATADSRTRQCQRSSNLGNAMPAQPSMMLCTGETRGWPGSAPSAAMIGKSDSPKASNDSSESRTSNT